MHGYALKYKTHDVICREGDPSFDLYYLQSGKLLICTISGTQVKPIARIGPGEFIGELSFFDGKTRSSHIVALEASEVIQIPRQEILPSIPMWYQEIGKNLTKKIRLLDHVIHDSNIRKYSDEENQPLSIDEQRILFALLSN